MKQLIKGLGNLKREEEMPLVCLNYFNKIRDKMRKGNAMMDISISDLNVFFDI